MDEDIGCLPLMLLGFVLALLLGAAMIGTIHAINSPPSYSTTTSTQPRP